MFPDFGRIESFLDDGEFHSKMKTGFSWLEPQTESHIKCLSYAFYTEQSLNMAIISVWIFLHWNWGKLKVFKRMGNSS